MELVAAAEAFFVSLGTSPWILVCVAVLATVDGFFPPVPSESVVIAVAVLSVAGDGPSLWALVPAAAVGALAGDVVAFTIGTRVRPNELRIFRGRRGRAALAHVTRRMTRSGSAYIVSARFVPVGRVAVNMSAGAVGFPRARFLVVAAVAAAGWAVYCTVLGAGAGHVLRDHPTAAIVVGVVGGLGAGVVVDRCVDAADRRRRTARVPSVTPAPPSPPGGDAA